MNRTHLWKYFLVLFVVLWSLYEIYPPTGRDVTLEFQTRARKRDADYTNIVQRLQELQRANPVRGFANLVDAIGTNDITRYFPFFETKAEANPNRYVLNRLQREAAGRIKLGLDLQGGTSFLVGMDTSAVEEGETNSVNLDYKREQALSQAVEVLRKRVDKFGVAEPIIQPAGADRILIQLPGLSDADKESALRQIQQAAFLEFRMVHEKSRELLEQGLTEPGYVILKEERTLPNGAKELIPYLVKKKTERNLTGKYVKNAFVTRHQVNNQPQIAFNLDSEGAVIFGQITEENVGRQLAIILDGVLYSAPVINEPIRGGSGVISGSFDIKTAIELANVLENPLEAPVKVIESREVDPSLGKDTIQSGVTASLIAAIGTVVFMLVFYFASGLVACVALALNVLILMGALCALGSTLTMPGIAGIALTIGMAVDANVLIYERMREEIAAGKSIRGVIAAGYQKAFGTIFDSNLTTVIAAVILIYLGTGPVKGFGVTLTVGICISMFTALFATRLVYDFLLARGWLTKVRMMPLAKFPLIRFMNWGKVTCTVSAILILMGLGYGISRGTKVLGVDFVGGDQQTYTFAQKVEADGIRSAVDDLKLGDATIAYQRELATGHENLRITTPFDTADKVAQALKDKFPEAKFSRVGLDKVGATVGKEIQRSAVVASALAMFAILVYVAFRYEFSFAVASVVALLHDVLITMSIYFLCGRQLSAPMVAAILTIIGYSINDKIVIMDRIREDLKLGVRGTFRELIDIALNQTLSRTIITGGAVILATLSLLIFGGGVINDFAFAFLVGVLAGTYSSLVIASPIVLWWHKGHRPALGSGVAMQPADAPAKALGE